MDPSMRADHTEALTLQWHSPTHCNSNGCVEVAFHEDQVFVRDSKRADSPMLVYTIDEWRIFIKGVKNSEFDVV